MYRVLRNRDNRAKYIYSDLRGPSWGPETESEWYRVWGALTKENWDAHVAREKLLNQERKGWMEKLENKLFKTRT